MLRINIKKILVVFWTISLLCFRPSIFGERYNLGVFVIFAVISLLLCGLRTEFKIHQVRFNAYLLILVLCLYLFMQGLLSGGPTITITNSCFLIASVALFIAFIAGHHKDLILKTIVLFHFWLAVSSIITITIFIASGFNIDSLPVVLNINEFVGRDKALFEDVFANHYVYFPLSHSWANVGFSGKAIPRLIGIYREAGMAQIFFFTAFFLTYLVELRHPARVRWVIFIGGVLTFSTAGLVSFLGGVLVMRYLPAQRIKITLSRIVVILFVIPAIVVAALFLPDIGLVNKVSSESGNQRSQSFIYSWKKFNERPIFGHGYYKGFEQMEHDKNYVQFLGLIGVMYQIGLIGIILYALPWIYAWQHFNTRKTYFVLIPCLITLLISQPNYNDMFVWFLLLVDFRSPVGGPSLPPTHHPFEPRMQ